MAWFNKSFKKKVRKALYETQTFHSKLAQVSRILHILELRNQTYIAKLALKPNDKETLKLLTVSMKRQSRVRALFSSGLYEYKGTLEDLKKMAGRRLKKKMVEGIDYLLHVIKLCERRTHLMGRRAYQREKFIRGNKIMIDMDGEVIGSGEQKDFKRLMRSFEVSIKRESSDMRKLIRKVNIQKLERWRLFFLSVKESRNVKFLETTVGLFGEVNKEPLDAVTGPMVAATSAAMLITHMVGFVPFLIAESLGNFLHGLAYQERDLENEIAALEAA